jgi:mono/diheme cytochrome c family protein
MKKITVIAGLLLLYACNTYVDLPQKVTQTGFKVREIPPYPQQTGGDPEAGFDYLLNGDYIGSGVPLSLFGKKTSRRDSILDRPGINATLPYQVTAFETANQISVVNGNCFTCHSAEINGQLVLGLGNSFSDFRNNFSAMSKGMNTVMRLRYKKDSEEWAAYEDFGAYFKAIAPRIRTNQPGVNTAARLAEACAMHRDPSDLSYREQPNFEMPDYNIATDVPPLWLMKKKNSLYYTAVGRGDFTKLLFQAALLGIPDSTQARVAITRFKDVLAWLETLEAPEYPFPVNQQLAAEGEKLFNEHCSKCHGTYGENPSYPNKVVSLEVVKTDPWYASYAVDAPIVEWYNQSWFALSEPKSWFEPQAGYVAPPLDGIWASAPYLHNGSVPTLEDLLYSPGRPAIWKRSEDSRDYDPIKAGWKYEAKTKKAGKWTYNTHLPAYSNVGHTFGDKLSGTERKALIEYLKTL